MCIRDSECKKAVSQVLARISQVTRPTSSNSVTMKTPSKRRRTTDGGAAPDVVLTSSGREREGKPKGGRGGLALLPTY